MKVLQAAVPVADGALGCVEQRLRDAFCDAAPEAKRVFLHLLEGGGKRVRPLVTLLSAGLFTDNVSAAVPVAAAMELIHMATLVHDDVIDASGMRRGRATVNHVWGNHSAVLAGDALLARALCLLGEVGLLDVITIVSHMIHRMCEGEITQHANLGNIAQTEADYFERIEKKTALFFAACCQAGALAACAPPSSVLAVGEYGRLMGLAFQVVDDVLDFTAEAPLLGKPVGGDLASGVITLPVIYALNQAQVEIDLSVACEKTMLDVLEVIRESGGIEYSLGIAASFVDRAKSVLPASTHASVRDALLDLADMVVHRSF